QAPGGQRVKDECKIDMLVGNHVFAAVNARLPESNSVSNSADAGDSKMLQLTVLSFIGFGGGGWSGNKSITIRADLMQGGKVLRTSVHQDQSRGGILGPGASTCFIFESVAKSLGRKVV